MSPFKRVVVGVGGMLAMAVGTFAWGPVSDLGYNLAYSPRQDKRAEVVSEVTPELANNLSYPVPSGSVSSEKNGFSWSSWHSGENHPYFYRFENFGAQKVYARSRLFTKLVGRTYLVLEPKQVVYYRLVDFGPSDWLTEKVNVSEFDSPLASTGVGTSMTLVMPFSSR